MSDLDTTSNNQDNQELPGATETVNDNVNEKFTQHTKSNHKSSTELSDLPDEWADEIRKLRKENAQRRLRESESEKRADEAARLVKETLNSLNDLKTFKESITKDLHETKEKMLAAEKRALNAQFEAEARKAGVVDFDIFTKLVDHSSLKVSNDGSVVGVDDVIKNLKQKHPILFDNRKINNTGNYGTPKPTIESKRDLTGLNKKDYKKEKDAFLKKIRTNY